MTALIIEQRHRDAAEEFIQSQHDEWHADIGDDWIRAERIAIGLADEDPLVLAFAAYDAKHMKPIADHARKMSKALTDLSGGGSEMFVKVGDEFYADANVCLERIRQRQENRDKLGALRQAQRQASKTTAVNG